MFKTLDDLKKGTDNDRDKKKEAKKKQTDSYVGGDQSGLAVENPDPVDQIIRRAQDDSREPNPGDRAASNCKITLFKNGFTVDDGPLRSYTDPANQKFLADLHSGHVPQELRAKHKDAVDVALEDKRAEEYKEPPPPKYIAFAGSGTSLGGEPPKTTAAAATDHQVKAEPPKVDKNKPITRIQLRLHNGQTHEVEVNLDTKVSVIFDYAWSLAPVNGEFQLIAGFPPKPLLDVTQTVEDAGLEDSKVIQKLL